MSDRDTKDNIVNRNNSDEDVTRIAKPAAARPASNIDKTQIRSNPQQVNDKTRIRKPATTSNEQTRLSNRQSQQKQTSDITQFNPQVVIPEDKTRINSRQTSKPGINTQVTAPTESAHGILKERFVLEKVLGAGGMGIVYKASDRLKIEAQDRDPYVAIKVLSEEFKTHPEAFISLQRESRKSQRIAHPNIVNVYDFDRDGDTVFMTMEFMDGQPLDQLIRQYKSTGLPTDDAWNIINGMSAALAHAHAQKIIHSDFKPGNVFVTNKGLAKVFDFGIARAVAKVEHLDDNDEDHTVFDAANLGALTPAYASLEMLEGLEPDIRDDIYALGCVAYELFTGNHPFNKLPANEAFKQGLKPRKISNIKNYQWKAIEKALAFHRKDRTESVDKFLDSISPKIKPANRFATALALLLSVAITVYFLFFQEKPVDIYSEFDIRNELELKIKIDFYKEDLENLIKNPTFTDPWQDSVWKNVSDLKLLTQNKEPWLAEYRQQVFDLYTSQIASSIDNNKFSMARLLIENARRYTDNPSLLDAKLAEINTAEQKQKVVQARLNKQRELALLEKRKTDQSSQQQESQRKVQVSEFNLALENVKQQLNCQGSLNTRNISTAVNKLREIDINKYKTLEPGIIKSLVSCITETGKAFPERAEEAKKSSLRIFNSDPAIAAIVIQPRDPCDSSLAGLGSRGKRAVCKDKIKAFGNGPELVVVPGNSRFDTFAIGKYEVTVDDLNLFCKQSSSCNQTSSVDASLPVSSVDISVVKEYLSWLSRHSGQKYRLPSRSEWLYAAKSRRQTLDANRNCKLSTRGIQKGEQLINANIGKQNSWGLVNYVGNVQEWVYDNGRSLVAVGGSYKEPMDSCTITKLEAHSGRSDKATGFRVLREIKGLL